MTYKTSASTHTPYNYLIGRKNLSSPINIGADKTLCFSVGGTDYAVTLTKDDYLNVSELAKDIQDNLPTYLKEKITVSAVGSRLEICENEPTSIGIIDAPVSAAQKSLYDKLFVGEDCKYVYREGYGTFQYNQGSTAPEKVEQASVVMPYPIPSDSIKITGSNNSFTFQILEPGSSSYLTKKIYVPERDKPYSKSELINEMNKQFKTAGLPVEASVSGGAFKLTTTFVPSGNNQSFALEVHSGSNGFDSILKELVGTEAENAYPNYYAGNTYIQGSQEIGTDYVINAENDTLSFSYDGKNITVKVPQGTYRSGNELAEVLEKSLDDYIDDAGEKALSGKLKVTNESSGLRITSAEPGTKFSPGSCSGTFYQEVIRGKVEKAVDNTPGYSDGSFKWDDAFVIGRQNVKNETTTIVKGLNDQFIIDFNYPDASGNIKAIPLQVTIPEGGYEGASLAVVLENLLNERLHAPDIGLTDFSINAAIGGHTTSVVGNDDANSLQFTLKCNSKDALTNGNYYLDGVRGSSAFVLFYKTVGLPKEATINGAVDISKGVNIQPGKNTFTFTTDGNAYVYTIPEGNYSGKQLVDKLNELVQKPDASGSVAPIRVMMDHGLLKLAHNSYGKHAITDVGGTAKGTIFYKEEGRADQETRMLQVGDKKGNDIELTRVLLNTSFMHINSVTISKPKYANKALDRLDYALNYLNKQRTKWGALNNRLQNVISVDGITAENTQDAESLLRDTDYAEEMQKNARANILQQTGQAMLAQNSVAARMVLQLLK